MNPSVTLKENTEAIINNFVNFYYACFNNKNIDELCTYYKNFTEIKFQNNHIKGIDNINSHYKNVVLENPIFHELEYSYLMSGARRANIVVNGRLTVASANYNFVEFIHLATTKEGYWIQSTIFKYF